ncbi:MAG: hypothetical protein K0S56_4136, partial [Microvirga sp.]|nr:hypothetical protein [Microvirga sp.]
MTDLAQTRSAPALPFGRRFELVPV